MTRWLIGIDEAGYGPKMGPLVIGASVWSIPEDRDVERLLPEMAPEFQSRPWHTGDTFLPMGDSKALYQDKRTLDSLRLAVRFLMDPSSENLRSTADLLRHVAPSDADRVEQQPWYRDQWDDSPWDGIPIDRCVAQAAMSKMQRLGIEFHGFHCRIIDEQEFNRAVAIAGNKANALGEWSIGLLRDCIAARVVRGTITAQGRSEPTRIDAYCDRQGGRKRYAPLLNLVFQDWSPWFEILEETATCSRYRCRLDSAELEVGFRVGGDAMLPAAAASMIAKWIRELLMHRLNAYWRSQIGDSLRPTAGYPVDAERFRATIQERATALTHPLDTWWRSC